MRTLVFDPDARLHVGRRVRAARFVERSNLSVGAVCVVANAVRESLAGLYGREVEVRLFAPVIPSASAWRAIAVDATIYRVRGQRAEAAIIVRASDALSLAAAAFGEEAGAPRPLSPIERRVLDRAVGAIADATVPVCGALLGRPHAEREAILAGYRAFFELQIERPVRARVGIALAREPELPATAQLRAEELLDVELELAVRIAAPPMTAGALALLELGALVPMTESTTLAGILVLAGREVARGECGVIGTRLAFAIGPSPEGSSGTPS